MKKYKYYKTGRTCGGAVPSGETVTTYVVKDNVLGVYYTYDGDATFDINKMHTVPTRKEAVAHTIRVFRIHKETLGSADRRNYRVYRLDFTPQVTFNY